MGSGATKGKKEVKEEKEEKEEIVDGYNVVYEENREEIHVNYNLFGIKASEQKLNVVRKKIVPASLDSASSSPFATQPRNSLKY